MTDYSRAYSRLMQVLEGYRRALAEADADPEMLHVFGKAIGHLRRLKPTDVAAIVDGTKPKRAEILSESERRELQAMSLEAVERLVTDPKVSRRALEEVAAIRFAVPRGSMRKWSASDDLREKILTRIRNERVHQTIASVAKGSGEKPRA